MTKEEKVETANKEFEALLTLYNEKIEEVTTTLKQTGKYKLGLDVNSEAYAPINREFDKRASEIFAKYDLPPGTKIKLR